MTLKTSLQNIVENVFDKIPSLLTSTTFVYYSSNPSYSTATRTVTSTTANHTVSMLLSKFRRYEIEDEIKTTDIKAVFPQNKLSVIPNLKCTVTISSIRHEIIDIKQDAAQTYWTLALRRG